MPTSNTQPNTQQMIAVKITTADGSIETTRINATLEEAQRYYMERVVWWQIWDEVTGEETKSDIVSVEQVD